LPFALRLCQIEFAIFVATHPFNHFFEDYYFFAFKRKMVERIASGPNKGFFVLPNSLLTEQLTYEPPSYAAYKNYQIALTLNDLVYYRYSPGPGKRILGFNRTLLPYIDGYYYVRKSSADIRRLLYALENRLVPSTGNTELFNINFDAIPVPDDYRPYYLEPCTLQTGCGAPAPTPAPSGPTKEGNLFQESTITVKDKNYTGPFYLIGWALLIGLIIAVIGYLA
jgi:hypothetical protein